MRDSAVVIGSLNQDTILKVPRFPQIGESLYATELVHSPGGKGANQAVQMAKLGVPTAMVGCVGDDGDGLALVDGLAANGVDVSLVRSCSEPTGMAAIEADEAGRVTCVVVRGANYAVSEADVAAAEGVLSGAAWLVLQMEIPQPVNARAIRRARELGCKVLLNAAPAAAIDAESLSLVDLLVVNEVEAAFFLGRPVVEPEGALEGARELRRRHGTDCVITLGSLGSVFVSAEGEGFVIPVPVEAVETTGAGDSYVGALVKALIDGASLEEACRFATRCAAVTVTRLGAQPAMPSLDDLSAVQ